MTMRENDVLGTVASKQEKNWRKQCNMTGKKKSLCVYFVMKKKKSQWPEWKASSSKMKTTAFANDLQRKISQRKTMNISKPANHLWEE